MFDLVANVIFFLVIGLLFVLFIALLVWYRRDRVREARQKAQDDWYDCGSRRLDLVDGLLAKAMCSRYRKCRGRCTASLTEGLYLRWRASMPLWFSVR